MLAYMAVPLTCWVCALVARPRRPHIGNEVEDFIYARLLGQQQRLTLLALLLTGGMLLCMILTLPRRTDSTLQAVRGAHAECVARLGKDEDGSARDETGVATVQCYELEAGGGWVEKEYRRGSGWRTIASVTAPIDPEKSIHGSKP
jgi:hypothetical protein